MRVWAFYMFPATIHVNGFMLLLTAKTLSERHAAVRVLELYGFGFWHFQINKRWKGRFLPRHPTQNKNTSIKTAKAWHGRLRDRSSWDPPYLWSFLALSVCNATISAKEGKKILSFHLNLSCKKLARNTKLFFMFFFHAPLILLLGNNMLWKRRKNRLNIIPPPTRHFPFTDSSCSTCC